MGSVLQQLPGFFGTFRNQVAEPLDLYAIDVAETSDRPRASHAQSDDTHPNGFQSRG